VKTIDVDVIRPTGSTFRLWSDEPPGRGGEGRAPDAIALISAGLGFCFMTQIGRFAKIAKHSLGEYHILQDTRFSVGDPTTDPPVGGRAAPPVTHVYLQPDADDDFARQALSMSEQTCFLHALCRAELTPKVRVQTRTAVS
jgi:organic hydroperoxide reductase OsmC/OhrA